MDANGNNFNDGTYIIAGDMKFKRKNETGDGNCLFRSIGTVVYGNANKTHMKVQCEIARHGFENWEKYKEIIMKHHTTVHS